MAGKVLIRGIGQPGVGVEGIEGDQALAGVDIPQFDGVVIGKMIGIGKRLVPSLNSF